MNDMIAATALRASLRRQLRLPAVAAPMFLVSGPDLVIAACRAGIVGSFPTLNARTPEILDQWFARIAAETVGRAPFAANLILHKSNPRRQADLDLVIRHKVPWVIASVGSPEQVAKSVHGYGGLVFADVASLRHARKAVAAGVDGLILLTAGAGGNTGWLNPFAFIAAVRDFYAGPIAVAGCITRGHELRALETLGADLGYLGSAFLAATESMAPVEHKQAVIAAGPDDILLTSAVTGMPANFVRSRLEEAGVINPDGSVQPATYADDILSWKNVWSAGQGVGPVTMIEDVATIVARLETEYLQT
jgi:nitronate monooxygenase